MNDAIESGGLTVEPTGSKEFDCPDCGKPSLTVSPVSPVFRRIHVTGNAGAGKTTLARAIGAACELPVFSLDSIVWQPGWRKTPPDERAVREQALIERPAWVIDGVSQRVRDAADLVVFLDLPRRTCARRALGRTVRHLVRQRPDLPEGCPEWKIVPRLLRIIWRFPQNAGLAIRTEARSSPRRIRLVRPGDDALESLRTELVRGAPG